MSINREELLSKVRSSTPYYTFGEDYPDLFGKYGVMTCGACEHWHWFTEENITNVALQNGYKPLSKASDAELLEMLAITNEYWKEG